MNILSKIFRRVEVSFLFFLGKIEGLFAGKRFYIKAGYRHRKNEVYMDDSPHTDEYQDQVYELARFHFDKNRYSSVLDIGCGSGFKLMKYFSDCDTFGIDVGKTVDFLKSKYPGRKWIDANNWNEVPVVTDLVICSDVIEHVLDPDKLLQSIKGIKFKLLFLTTPERDMVRGWYHYGPPDNEFHIREWNAKEFHQYVSNYFDVKSQQITSVKDATQLLICEKYQ